MGTSRGETVADGGVGRRYRRYRLADPAAEEAMARSLRQYGQLAPVTACWRDGRAELLDGFKRQAAAQQASWPTLSVRLLEVDERSAKAAILGLNGVGRRATSWKKRGSCRRWCVKTGCRKWRRRSC